MKRERSGLKKENGNLERQKDLGNKEKERF